MQAAQAVEPSILIAFQLLAPKAKIILVGDPQQLPPTILSRSAQAANFTQSLFQRLQQVSHILISSLELGTSGVFSLSESPDLSCTKICVLSQKVIDVCTAILDLIESVR